MSTASLLSQAGFITKDPDHDLYSATKKYEMLSVAQSAIVTLIDLRYLDFLKKVKSHTSISSPGTFDLESDYLRHCYWETSNGNPIENIQLQERSVLRNEIYGGNDLQPVWYVYRDGTTKKGRVVLTTYSLLSSTDQFYVMKPPDIGASQEPVIEGFDAHILSYVKYMFHMLEGQADLAQASYSVFLKSIEPFLPNDKLSVQGR